MGAPWRAFAAAVVTGACGLAVSVACSSPYASEPTAADDAGAQAYAQETGVTQAVDPCLHAAPPGPPEKDDAPDVSVATIVVALSVTDYAQADVPGFDLDGTCTCDDRPNTAHGGAETCTHAFPSCDFDAGIDNGMKKLVDAFGSFYDLSSVAKTTLSKGRSNLLVELAGYNGKANDADVSVAFYASDGITQPTCPTSEKDPFTETYTPGWCGDDVWTIRPESVVAGVPTVTARGYVHDWQLVVRPSGSVGLPFNDTTPLVVPGPIVAGKLVPLGEDLKPRDPSLTPTGRAARLWELDGLLGGRVPAQNLLAVIGSLHLPSGDGGIVQVCQQASYPTIATAICNGTDIAMLPARDNVSSRCSAVSLGLPFVALPAQKGATYVRPRGKGTCDPKSTSSDGTGYDYRCP